MTREVELAILFADVSDSTRLYEKLGDVAARAIVADCLDTMTAVTRRLGGLLARTIGDEVLSTFVAADAAAEAAAEMQDAISRKRRPVAIRIGFHFGPVLVDGTDVHGDAVNLASRVASEAKPGQILTTVAAHRRMAPHWRAATRQVAHAELRGRSGPVELFEVIWRAADATFVQRPAWIAPPAIQPRLLVLTAGARRIALGEERRSVTVGRDERNDVVLTDNTVSRIHAQVEYRNGRFLLLDRSANGTYLAPDDGASALVHRDSVELSGRGLLGLGAPPAPGSLVTIRYERT